MTARELEARQIATVIIGSAMDIVTHCKVPRYLHTDLPLGNPLGKPYDHMEQAQSVLQALSLVVYAKEPRVVVSSARWSDNEDWKANYGRIDATNRAELLEMGEATRRQRAEDRAKGLVR